MAAKLLTAVKQMTDDGRTSVVFVLIFILGILQYLLNTAIELLDYLERDRLPSSQRSR